jgi:rhamnosyltransferase subunit B
MGEPARVVLLGWELGAGLGHARRLLYVARNLQRRGWSAIVAARQPRALADEYRAAGIPLVQAPISEFHRPKNYSFEARGYADIMAACGYQRVDTLLATVAGWDGLIDVTRPRVIVADYSPMLALAACGRIPLIVIGSGFAVPPAQLARLPLLRPNGTAMLDEDAMLGNAAEVQRRRGRAAPATVPELVGGQAQVVCTFSELDVYSEQRLTPATGPVTNGLQPLSPPKHKAIFAYLESECRFIGDLLLLLLGSRLSLEVFIRNCSERQRQVLRNAGVTVHEKPPALAQVLSRASVIMHHGGIGTAETCLALGRAQVVAPLHLEQMANAKKLLQLGAAGCVLQERTASENRDALAGIIASDMAALRAAEIATSIAARQPSSSLERIADMCERLAA